MFYRPFNLLLKSNTLELLLLYGAEIHAIYIHAQISGLESLYFSINFVIIMVFVLSFGI